MADSPYIVDVTTDSFNEVVVKRSYAVPILVDFWAAWCGPCKTLIPILERLANAYQGQFILAKVNIDQEQALASQYKVQSVPTVKLVYQGKILNEFLGALSEAKIRQFLEPYLIKESDKVAERAKELMLQGELAKGLALLEEASAQDPDNQRVLLLLIQILAQHGEIESAEEKIRQLPANLQEEIVVQQIKTKIAFAKVVAEIQDSAHLEQAVEADPHDNLSRYRLGAYYALQGTYEKALDQFLAILRHDRRFQDEAGRKSMIAVFNLLNNQGEIVNRYRGLMFAALH